MKRIACWFLVLVCVALVEHRSHAEVFRFAREHVLCTSLEWTIDIEDRETALRTEQVVLEEIAKWDRVFSRYRNDSVLAQWSQGEIGDEELPHELIDALDFAEKTRLASAGAFDIRVNRLQELWSQAIEENAPPSQAQRRAIVESFRQAPYDIQAGHLRCDQQIGSVTLDAFAKGLILDKVCERIDVDFPEAHSFCINIGGDLKKSGVSLMQFSIENPFSPAEQTQPMLTWETQQPLAIATSGGYRRFMSLGEQRISHIFDPRTGLPADSLASVTVVAPDAMRADAFATVVSVLGRHEGLRWIEEQPGSACFIVDSQGAIASSSRWNELIGSHPSGSNHTADFGRIVSVRDKDEAPGLHVQFELARVGGGGYRRPYVAIWLEDEENFPVKTALLWMQTEQPGPRWHRDLTRWYRNDRVRKISEKVDLIETIAGATRGPGEYEAHFDGTDNTGKALKAGTYTLCLEAARENGTYQIIRQAIVWGEEAVESTELKGNVEISKASYRFVPGKATN
jgi:thiamine biosynthesis lipoprotein